MATETESWECVEECTPRSESEDSCGIIVSDSASRSASRLGSRGTLPQEHSSLHALFQLHRGHGVKK